MVKFKRGDKSLTGEVAGRDASWYSRPDVHSDKALHPVCADGMSPCGIALDVEYGAISALETETVCGKRACQKAFQSAREIAERKAGRV